MNDVTHSAPGALTAIELQLEELAREAMKQTGAAGATVAMERAPSRHGEFYTFFTIHLYADLGGEFVGAQGVRACGLSSTFTGALLKAGLNFSVELAKAQSLEPAAL